jgi:hypothetical protein
MIDGALKYTEVRAGVFSVSVVPGTTRRLLAYLQETLERDAELFREEMQRLWEMKELLEERYSQVKDDATKEAAASLRRAFKKARQHFRAWARRAKARAGEEARGRAGAFAKQFQVDISPLAFQRSEKAGIKGLLPHLAKRAERPKPWKPKKRDLL